jgi:membrane fusion protein (multidrug efflux system)/multidrug efflux system membrane fusion protein
MGAIVSRGWRALFFALLTAGLLTACKGQQSSGAGARKAGRSLAVRTAPVAARDVVYTAQALGSLEPEEQLQITAQVSGAVQEVLFHAGDKVTADTVLARIDPDRYRFEAERAEAAHRRSVADWKRAESDLARREALSKEKLVAEEELNRARQEAERLAADAASAKASADIAVQNVRHSIVRSPRNGELNTRTVEPGQFVQIGHVLATLVDLRRLRLRFRVSESESLKTREGEAVSFTVASLGGTSFQARVYHVSGIADPATRQVEVLAWVDNPGVLKPGFFAEVALSTATNRNAVVVAEGAVQATERGFVVYAVENGLAKERAVKIGMRTGDGSVEILSGLKTGETIVVEGSDRLADGMAVEAVQAGRLKPAPPAKAAP